MSGIMLAFAGGAGPSIPIIGAAYGGGFFAGQISTAGNGIADYNLVVGPVASAQNSSKLYKTTATATAGTASVIDGPANSTAMNNASHPAALFCKAVTAGGFTDWYMPAKNELEICYYNLKPTTANNVTTTGTNSNAVPARASNYTISDPAQTSAADFKNTGAEDFSAAFYWSSTQASVDTYAWRQYFGNGGTTYIPKDNAQNVRAVRRLPV